MHNLNLKNTLLLDFPFGTVDGNLPANAEDVGSVTGPGRFQTPQSDYACAPQLLSLRPGAHEPQPLSPGAATAAAPVPGPVLHQSSHHGEKAAHCSRGQPLPVQPEKAHAQQARPSATKDK